jgi:CRP-like cAMP-binding protein
MRSDVERALGSVPLFRQLDRATMLDLAHNADLRDFAAGEMIVTEGDPADSFFVVVAGEVEVVKEQNLPGHKLVRLGAGDSFGELSIFDGKARSASVRATADTTCLVIPRWEILHAVENSADVARKLLAYLSSRLRDTTDALAAV